MNYIAKIKSLGFKKTVPFVLCRNRNEYPIRLHMYKPYKYYNFCIIDWNSYVLNEHYVLDMSGFPLNRESNSKHLTTYYIDLEGIEFYITLFRNKYWAFAKEPNRGYLVSNGYLSDNFWHEIEDNMKTNLLRVMRLHVLSKK